jgi:predicted transcriptional regulator
MTTVTLDLPRQIYQKAAQIAKATKRPIEQVVVEWIRPPVERVGSVQDAVLAGLEAMSTAQLTQVARSGATAEDTERLRELLSLQEQRELTEAEQDEAARLVEQEDLITLRKAKAIYLLKQRNALPDELAALLS